MASKKPKTVLYRRRREGRTDYNRRLKLLLAKKPRLVVRFTNQKIIAQVNRFSPQGDKVEVALDSSALKKLGWNLSLKNTSAAYLTGLLIGKKAQKQGLKEAILDSGFKTPQKKGKVYAFLKGALDAGLNVPHGSEEIFPAEERLGGKHLKSEAAEMFQKVKDKING